jgi:peptide/nickel transport system substrate-binding protein
MPTRPARRACACAFAALAFLGALAGCGRNPSASAPPGSAASARTLVIAATVEPNSLNPMLLEGTLSSMIGGILYSFLLTQDARGRQIPDAATTVPTLANGGISPDGLRVTYHLRPGLRWSDGRPLTARDCIFTFHAIMNPRTNVPDRYGYDKIADVTAPDDRTVVVHLRAPFSPIIDTFLTMESNYPILPEHNLGMLADLNHADVERPVVGSGPFTLLEWKHGDHLTFAANPSYFAGKPRLDRLVMRFVPEPATIVNELRTHEVDAALELDDPNLYAQIAAIPATHVLVTPAFGITTLYLNSQSGVTTDVRIRRAIAQAIDTDVIVRHATRGLYGSAGALRGQFGDDALGAPVRFDPAAARGLLDAAGWRVGPDGVRSRAGRPLAPTLIVSSTNETQTILSLQIKEQLRAVGIDVTIRSFDPKMLKAPAAEGGPLFGGRYDLALANIYSSAGPFAGQFFICAERAPTGFNLSRFCDPAVDRLFADIIAANDPQRRSRDARSIEALLATELPQLPLAQVRTIAPLSNRVHGIVPTPATPYVDLWKWSIDP